jgi:glycosyltransferase involved in cell wall biosynthesis
MEKIRVVHHSKTIGYSGTDRTAQLMCKYLAKDPRFEPFLVYRDKGDNSRLDIMRSILGEGHVVEYHWEPGRKGRNPPYLPEEDNLYEVLQKIDPDIVHVHRSGYQEWPMKYLAPRAKWFETNIFGFDDKSGDIDTHIYISDYIRQTALKRGNPDGPVLYNPVEMPREYRKGVSRLKERMHLPDGHLLLGRVGRADNFDPIALAGFREVLYNKGIINITYAVVNACQNWHNYVMNKAISGVHFMEPIIGDQELSEFYQDIDIYAHARSDGECCPCNIQEAMIHGLPVVSHRSPIYNGQSEIIGDAGFVVPVGDWQAYAQVLSGLIENHDLRMKFALKARERAESLFEASKIVEQLKVIYGIS